MTGLGFQNGAASDDIGAGALVAISGREDLVESWPSWAERPSWLLVAGREEDDGSSDVEVCRARRFVTADLW